MYTLEVIGFNIESCLAAQAAGAHRIELCDNPGEGGTTPSFGFIKAARKEVEIDLFPIIRPRGGDFYYSEAEFNIMKDDIAICKKLGCNGVVFGMLNGDGTVQKDKCRALVNLAYPMEVTFHRAFDRTADAAQALEDIVDIGCTRILTSGQKQTALDGVDLLTSLIQQAENRIIIMPGSGVRSGNISELATKTGATEFHTSARKNIASKMTYENPFMQENLQQVSIDEIEVKKIIELLNSM